jgi:glycosyltransferase involved in cell wall biosynthesis
MKTSDNLVSIIMPVRNGEHIVEDTLLALLDQTYSEIEIIVVDDNSSDNTFKALRRVRRKDKRVFISQNVKTYGLSITLNRALKKAKGQYIAFMNMHDSNSLERIKRQVLYLKRHPKVVAVGTQAFFLDEAKRRIGKSEFPTEHHQISKNLLTGTAMQLESVMINRYLLPKDILKFDHQKFPDLYRSLFMKIISFGDFANINEHLYYRSPKDNHLEELRLQVVNHVALWTRAWFTHENRPSFQSLFSPLNSKVRSSLN